MRLGFARSAAISLALCAMLLRALLPDGWMPNAGSGAPFVICSADGTHPGGKAPSAPERSHAPCAFAAAAPLAPPAAAAFAIAPSEGPRLAIVFAADSFVRAAAFRPNAARAPPAFS